MVELAVLAVLVALVVRLVAGLTPEEPVAQEELVVQEEKEEMAQQV